MLMYDRVFQILKNKIESGLLPEGTRLPSRADLCRELGASEKTVRRVLTMLEEEGYIETAQRRRPVVRPRKSAGHQTTRRALEKIDKDITSDVMKTAVLVCYPVIKKGISRSTKEDLQIPRRILDSMKIADPAKFWRLSKQFYRFFVARNENALILQAVDGLGLADLRPLRDDIEARTRYYEKIQEFMVTLEMGGTPESVRFDDMSGMYGMSKDMDPAFKAASDSALLLGRNRLETLLEVSEIRYSTVYMDILGLIAAGRYRRGDRLPTHRELRKIYDVSVDTTIKAIQILQEWGVVTTVRGSGIYVKMDRDDMWKVQVSPHLIAYHVRRYLDTLELLTLTVEGAASCAAANITKTQVQALRAEIDRQWNKDYLYGRTPAILLDFITAHLGIEALDAVYSLLCRNIGIGRSIPGLLTTQKTPVNCEIHEQCMEAVEALSDGDQEAFAQKAVQAFESIYRLVVEECKRLRYYETAKKVYDGSALWK
ncbi:MAG: GntR family transcriptional regulator [Oscillospiraceae bacterium]|nr:GntR family transcriptional regulator [Oscillospiraceae bacterium]